MRVRAVRGLVVVGLVVLLGACDWASPRFSPNGSGNNSSETAIGVANLNSLALDFAASIPGYRAAGVPIVSDDHIFVTSERSEDGMSEEGVLASFDATPDTCTRNPADCTPEWTANVGDSFGQATTANGFVIVGAGGDLLAFDEDGIVGCGGSPRRCDPVWTAPGGAGSPVAVDGVVFVAQDEVIQVYDANGVLGCGVLPRTCAPLRTYVTDIEGMDPALSPPAIGRDDVLAVGYTTGMQGTGERDGGILAYDAAGVVGCAGIPVICQPVWEGDAPGAIVNSPAVIGRDVYASYTAQQWTGVGDESTGEGGVVAFDVGDCFADPDGTCDPEWYGPVHGVGDTDGGVAVADDLVHVASRGGVATFAADGCGAEVCAPLRTYVPEEGASWTETRDPIVANGVLYVSGRAFDASGAERCEGSPVVCVPMWSAHVDLSQGVMTIVSDGRLVVIDAAASYTEPTTVSGFFLAD